VEKASATDAGRLLDTSTTKLEIGNRQHSAELPFKGDLALGVLWNEAPSSNEIAAMFRGANPWVIRHDKQIFYSLVEGNADPESDYTKQDDLGAVADATKSASNPPVVPLQNHMCGGMG